MAKLLMRTAGALWAAATGITATFIALVGESKIEPDDDRRVQDSELSGELNYRTGRIDSGADPYGWYDGD